MNEPTTDNLAHLVSKRLACLQQLHAIGLNQAQLIAGDRMSELLRLIATKQKLIVALQAIEQALQPYHRQHPESRVWASPVARQKCAAEAEACRKLLAEVMALEQTNEQQMTVRRDATSAQLNTAASANKVRGAYQSQQYRTDNKASAAPTTTGVPTPSLDLHTRS